MNFTNLSDDRLEFETIENVHLLKRCEIKLLYQLAEIERRRMYSKKSQSLFAYCIDVLGLEGNSIQIRIDTMRAMKINPEIVSKLETCELSMSVVSKAHTFFRQEAKLGKKYSVTEKCELLQKLEGKSVKETMRELVMISPEAIPQEKRRPLDGDKTEVKVVVSQELLNKLDLLKNLWSHRNPTMTDLELLEMMANECLKKADPAQKSTRKISLHTSEADARYISPAVKKAVWIRDKSKCTYSECKSKHLIQCDHIIPVAMGGKSTVENLRLRCHAHNQRAAIEKFGFRKMNLYINKT
jgi:hypothetical protein